MRRRADPTVVHRSPCTTQPHTQIHIVSEVQFVFDQNQHRVAIMAHVSDGSKCTLYT